MYATKFVLLLTLLMLALSSQAAPKVEDYGVLPTTSQMTLSPSGKKMAFRKVEGEKDTLIVYSLEQNKVLRAVDITSVNPQHLYFISDTQLVIRVGQQKKLYGFKGDSHYISTAHVLDTEKGRIEQLLKPGDGIYLGQTNVGSIIGMSPDHKFVYMPAYINPNKKGGADYSGGRVHYSVMKVDLSSPRAPVKINAGDKDAIDYFMGPKGEVLVQERYGDHSNRHEILVKNGSNWRQIYDVKVNMREIVPVGLTPDYKSLVILSYAEDSDRTKYLLMSLADGKISDPGFGQDNADVDGVIDDLNRVVHGVQYSGFVPTYKLFDEKKNQFIQKIIEKFPEHSVFPISWSENWDRVLIRVEGSGYPIEYYLFDKNLEPKFLGAAYAKIKPEDVHPIAKLTVKARDDLAIPTLLTIPRASVANMKNLPAVMLPHGGPRAYDQIGFDWLTQALANEGYLVIQPQFRGSAGFGYKHYRAGHGEWGGKMQDDLTDVLTFLTDKGYVNKSKVCIAGASYGGYAALLGGALTPAQYQCVVSINGISNLNDFIKDDRAQFGRYSQVLDYWEKFMTADGLKSEALKPISPYFLAGNYTAPVLLIHGENDMRVRSSQSEMMASSLKKAKKSVRLIKLEDENHYLINSKARLQTVREVVRFINKNLK
jgi:Dipeptidyl aminopeptidases/acylaminoacyl-peptidases